MFGQLRENLSTRMRGITMKETREDGTPTPPKLTSILHKLTSWAKIGVRSRFRVLDVIVNCALLTPLAVLFQVSACGIHDAVFLNQAPGYIGTVILLTIGFIIEFGCSFWQEYLASIRYVKGRPPDDGAFVVSTRLYHLAIGFANVCHYRGLSDIYYYLMGYGSYAALQATTTTVVLLLSLRCARNVLGPPLCVGVDTAIDDFFQTSTLFRAKGEGYMRHAADHGATVGVVTSLCFLHWIVVWAFFDCVIYPDSSALSVVTSWIIGYAIVTLAFMFESRAIKISHGLDNSNQTVRTLFEDVFLLLSNCGVILIWRGHWMFFEGLIYYFPIYHNGVDITAFYGLFSSFMMMSLLHATNTLILKGCDYDGELTEGLGVSFGVDYFANFFQDEILQEEALEQQCKKRAEEEERVEQARAFLATNSNLEKRKPKEKTPISLQRLTQLEQQKRKKKV